MSPAACAPASPAADRVRDALGVTGGVLLAFCLVPQLWKIHRTKSATGEEREGGGGGEREGGETRFHVET